MQASPSMQATGAAFPVETGRSSVSGLLRPALRGHAPLLALVIVHIACAVTLASLYPGMSSFDPATFVMSLCVFVFVVVPVSLVFLRLYDLVRHEKPKHPIPALARSVWRFVRTPTRLVNGAVIVALYIPFISTFSYLKNNITVVQPFSWDATFHDWDVALFFGHMPWEVFHPLLGFPLVTLLINLAYNLWFFVMWVMVVAFAFATGPSELRTRFFVSYMLTWAVGGNLLAIVFSSAGPCFYGLIGLQPDPYLPLMTYLHDAHQTLPLWAVDTQALLWAGYEGRALEMGISAMPSMHNATSLLLALAGFKVHRWLGIALSLFAAVIFVGSIVLAWHYAVDAFLAYAIVAVTWIAAGRFARWWEGRDAAVADKAAFAAAATR